MQGAFCSNAGLTCMKGEGRKDWVEKPYSPHSAKISNSWPGQWEMPSKICPLEESWIGKEGSSTLL